MKKTLRDTLHILKYNIKTLFYFELMYRLLGVIIIFPLAQWLFFTSIKQSGYQYITNSLLVSYVTKPFTLLSVFVIIVILSFYMMIEMILLSMIFDSGAKKETLSIHDLLIKGSKRIYIVLKRYHVRIFFPAFLFFILVELFHVVGIAQTINVPREVLYFINQYQWLRWIIIMLLMIVFILFIETIFLINLYAIDKMTPKEARFASKNLLKGKRLEMSIEFLVVNVLLNLILYACYTLLILIVSFIVKEIGGTSYALSVFINILYSLYVVIGLIATLTLVPINFALMTSWYEEGRQNNKELRSIPIRKIKMNPFKHERALKWVLIVVSVVLFVTNLLAVINVTQTKDSRIEILNYAEIIAHRGQSVDAPENTLAAIKLAEEQGVHIIEIDVRETLDHIPVVIHDATTKRTTNDQTSRYVKSLTLDELKLLDAGSWFSTAFVNERIPTLEEVIQLIDEKTHLFLELKDKTAILEESVIQLLVDYEMLDRTAILSFSNQQLERVKNFNSDVETMLLLNSFLGRHEDIIAAHYADHYALSLSFYTENESFVDLAHQSGKKVYVWTVNTQTDLEKVVDSDIDGIITDQPVLAREIANAKNAPDFLVELIKRFFKKNEQGLN